VLFRGTSPLGAALASWAAPYLHYIHHKLHMLPLLPLLLSRFWHEHLNYRQPFQDATSAPCLSCAAGKQHCDPSLHHPLTPHTFMRIHTDLSGPARAPGTGGAIDRVTITDDVTRWRWLELLSSKREETILEALRSTRLSLGTARCLQASHHL
jgi:hypothetical protein